MSNRSESSSEATIWDRAPSLVFQSEADVEEWLIRPLLEALGYSSTDIRAKPPITFQQGRVGRKPEADYMVYHGPLRTRETSLIVVEAKKPTELLAGALAQAESYAFNTRAPLLLLTNGIDLEIWQLQQSKDSELVFSCKVVDLRSSRGRIEGLLSRDAAVAHCRSLDIKPLPSPTGQFAAYEQAELTRMSGFESIGRRLKAPDGEIFTSDALLASTDGSGIIFAPSGFGKSTLSSALHKATFAQRLLVRRGLLSVEIQLPDMVASELSLCSYAQKRIAAHSPSVSEAALADEMRAEGVLLLCDRMDRVPANDRAKVEAEIRNLIRDYPSCRVLIFDRGGSSAALALPAYELLELAAEEQRAMADLVLPARSALALHQLPKSLSALAAHPLLLRLILTHYAKEQQFPHRLSELFETWIDQLLDRNGTAPSIFAKLRVALEEVAVCTATAGITPQQALAILGEAGHDEAAFDALVASGAILSHRTVEVQHEALADYLRSGRLLTGADADVMARLAAAPIAEGSLLPSFLVEGAGTVALQRAVWDRIRRVNLATYVEALRYRGDLARHYPRDELEKASELVAQDVLAGIADPLHAFFPQLAGWIAKATAGAAAPDIAIIGELNNDNWFTYALRAHAPDRGRIEVGWPQPNERQFGLDLKRSGLRIDSGRLIGFRRLREEVNGLVKRRWLNGGPLFANERLIGRLRFLEAEYGFQFTDVDGLEEFEALLTPNRGQFAGDSFSKVAFWIDELFEDIMTLRAAGVTKVDRWWTQYPPLSLGDPEGVQALLNAHWERAQRIYVELVEHSFAPIKDELLFFSALPVRYDVTLYPSTHFGISSHESWLPVATWKEAGAEVRVATAPPPWEGPEHFAAAAAAFAHLKRNGLASLSMGMGPAPNFTGESLQGFDGETGTLRAAVKMLDADLERLLGRALFREPQL